MKTSFAPVNRRGLAMFLSFLISVATLATLSPAPAAAATCRTRGHAYLISLPSGTVHFSGFEGDPLSPGVWTTRRDEQFQLGGNGIRPGTTITWSTRNALGQPFDISPQPPNRARSNCVVHQSPPTYVVTAPPGFYEVYATYTAGNSGGTFTNLVTYARVVP